MADLNMPLDKWFEVKVDRFNKKVRQVADEVATEGEAMVKAKILTSGTGRTWARTRYKRGKARSGSFNGRVWTGDMIDAVENEVVVAPSATIASFGWINTFKQYFADQEGGFVHPDTGATITGMFAMGDAADNIGKIVEQKMGRVLNEF